jgi:hypothetical protein
MTLSTSMSSGGAVNVVAAKEWHNSLTLTLLRSNAGDEPGTRVERGRVGGAAAFLREGALVTGFLSAGASAAGALGALCIQSHWQHCTSKKSWIPQGGDRPKVNQTIVACSLCVLHWQPCCSLRDCARESSTRLPFLETGSWT